MARTFKVTNFEKFQHYKDRNPPWIRLYNTTLDNYEIGHLPDASKAHLFAIWLLASRYENQIPFDPEWIAKKINATAPVDLDVLLAAGQIEMSDARSKPLARRKQVAVPEERRGETEKNPPSEDRARAPTPKPKGTRLALDWRPSEEAWAYARNLGLLDGEITAEADEFREYFTGKDCAKPVKRDWLAAWQRWVRGNAGKRIRNRPRGPATRGASIAAARNSILAKAGVRGGATDGLHADAGGGTIGDIASQARAGTVIEADGWREVPGSADGVEASDATEPGEHGGLGGADGGLPQAADGVPSGRGAVRAYDAAGHEPVVACVAGASGAVGDADVQAPADAEGFDAARDMPAFMRRTA